jgi:6-phosphogluconolactonase
MKNMMVFTGAYSQTLTLGTGEVVVGKGDGICVFRMNPESGALEQLSSTKCANPTFVALDHKKKHLYTTNEIKNFHDLQSGAACAYAVDKDTGALTFINQRITGGLDSAHIYVSSDDKYAMVANFKSGSTVVIPIEADGSLGKPTCFLQHKGTGPDPIRQEGPHAHQVMPDREEKRVFVPDLGNDTIVVYDVDWEMGYIYPNKAAVATVTAGEGPRHCVFNAAGDKVYLITEMGNTIHVYDYDKDAPSMKEIQVIGTVPDSFKAHTTTAAVKMHPNGKLLYGSNRGHNSLATYRVDEKTGKLTILSYQSTGGEIPRDFDISPDGKFLIAGNQDTATLVVFRVNEETGDLTEVFRAHDVFNVTCVVIAEMD